MNRRGTLITLALFLLSFLAVAGAFASAFFGMYEIATLLSAGACYLVLLAVYLEVYSQRG